MVTSIKKLVNLPSTDAGKLQYLLKHHSHLCITPELVAHTQVATLFNTANGNSTNPENIGIIFEEPAQRLLSAFKATKKNKGQEQLTFQAFYSNPSRVNLYHRLLSSMTWEAFGFVGICDRFYQSTLLSADWMGTNLFRLPYSSMFIKRPQASVSEEDALAIKQLYQKDYAIYEKAKVIFEARWTDYQQRMQVNLAADKQVYIHLGPPKTGTSAIQSWLHTNRKRLADEGFHYPTHSADANGVSSGNFERIISVNHKAEKHYFDYSKCQQLIAEFNKSDKKVLLLSSEHFYYYLVWFFLLIPKAKYIFYIRHPLAIAESGFHQEVKRHNRTEPFSVENKLSFVSLNIVERMAAEFCCNVVYRFFDNTLYKGGTLLSDFAACIASNINVPEKVRKLNTQYSPGAIRLMLACNTFASSALKTQLDTFLQKYSEAHPAFSFVTLQDYNTINNALINSVEKRHYDAASPSKEKLIALLSNYVVPKSCDTKAVMNDVKQIIALLIKQESALALQLYNEAKTHHAIIEGELLHNLLSSSASFKTKRHLVGFISILKAKTVATVRNTINRLLRG